MFCVDNSLKDGVYKGITQSYTLSIGKDGNAYIFLKVEVDNNGYKPSALYRTKFNIRNTHFMSLIETFGMGIESGQYLNLDLLCNVPVSIQIKMNGEYANIKTIKVLYPELDAAEDLDDNVDGQESDYVSLNNLG